MSSGPLQASPNPAAPPTALAQPGIAPQAVSSPFQSVNPSGMNNGFVTPDQNGDLIRLMQQQQLPTAFANSQQQKVDELQRLQPLQQQKWDELNRTQPLQQPVQQPLQQPVIGGGLLGGNRQNLRERRRQ